jgi:hypothetical protein
MRQRLYFSRESRLVATLAGYERGNLFHWQDSLIVGFAIGQHCESTITHALYFPTPFSPIKVGFFLQISVGLCYVSVTHVFHFPIADRPVDSSPQTKRVDVSCLKTKSTNSSYPILVPLSIFRENFMKNIKKPHTADTLYLDEGVGNE